MEKIINYFSKNPKINQRVSNYKPDCPVCVGSHLAHLIFGEEEYERGKIALLNEMRKKFENINSAHIELMLRAAGIKNAWGTSNWEKPPLEVFKKLNSIEKLPETKGSYLRGADFECVNLRYVELSNVNLEGANLVYADLEGADLRNANLRNADLKDADLMKANLSNSYLKSTKLWKANLKDANLSYVDLRYAYIRNVNLNGAYLKGADLSNAYLSESDLKGADLRNADLRNADLWNSDLKNIKINELTNFNDITIDRKNAEKLWELGVSKNVKMNIIEE